MKPDAVNGDRQIVTKGHDGNGVTNYGLGITDGKVRFILWSGDGSDWHVWHSTDTVIPTGTWTHVAVTFTFGDGANIRAYVNGAPVSGSWTLGDGDSAPYQTTEDLLIGLIKSGMGDWTQQFQGLLDEVHLYDRALDGAEVATLHASVPSAYAYDANGNMTGRAGETLAYDTENRLVSWTDGTDTATFVYDADGKRVAKTEGGTTTVSVNQWYEKDVTGGVETVHYWHGTKLMAVKEGSTLRYVHQDHLGSVSMETDAFAAFARSASYSPFGGLRAVSGASLTERGFTSHRLDALAGLTFMQGVSLEPGTLERRSHPLTVTPLFNGRFYDAELGRFIQADTIVPYLENPQTLDRYAYVVNNPLRYTDPDGHIFPFVAIAVVAWTAFEIGSSVYDAYTTVDTLRDPYASREEKLVTTGLFFAGLALPGGGYSSAGKWGSRHLLSFTKRNFRENLIRFTGKTADEVKSLEAHHILPLKFERQFERAGIDVNDPRFGTWVRPGKDGHQGWSYQYNKEWEKFFRDNPNPTQNQVLQRARELTEVYPFDVSF